LAKVASVQKKENTNDGKNRKKTFLLTNKASTQKKLNNQSKKIFFGAW